MSRRVVRHRDGTAMNYAGFWRRAGALLVDVLVLGPITAIYWTLFGISPPMAIGAVLLLGSLSAAYPIVFHARWGQTLGKMATKIKVVQRNGRAISLKHAFLRNSVDVALWVAFGVSAVLTLATWDGAWSSLGWSERMRLFGERKAFNGAYGWISNGWLWSEVVVLLFNRRRRALHDFIAGTVVVKLGADAQRLQLPLPALESH
jgi:uncharacterized RDD family membrane protein YckC